MVRIRSLAKELRHLEKQKQAATPSPPPAHADPVDAAGPAGAPSSVGRERTSAEVVTTPQEKETPSHAQTSPPAQTDEAASAASSSPPPVEAAAGEEERTGAVSGAGNGDESGSQHSSASSFSEDGRASAPPRKKHDATNLFSLGGSRFDILMNGSYGDGSACRKSDVRKATKVCFSGKDALQRSQEDLTAGDGAEGEKTGAGGVEKKGGGGTAADSTSSPPPPPPPPLGTTCGIPTRAPFKRLLAQPFSHVLVCDFEATCASGSVHYPHEIIEFPVVVLDTATLRIVAEFHRYVKPVRNPKLTPFCTELTGITQEMVDGADTLPVVLDEFQAWLEAEVYPLCSTWAQHYGPAKLSHNLKSEQKRFVYDDRTDAAKANAVYEAMICVATDGPWDMRRFMHECSVMRDGIDFPPVCYRYINVRHSYSDHFKCRQVKLTHMLKKMSMTFEGRRHSGIDDTRNITRVLAELMARGYRVHHVSTIKYSHRGDAFLASNQAAQELLSEYGENDKTHGLRHGTKANNNGNSGGGGGAKRNGRKK